MRGAASILGRARTEGGPIARPAGFPRLPADAVIPPRVDDLASATGAVELEPEDLREEPVSLADKPPRQVAFLHVQAHALDHDRWAFSLMGMSSVANFPETKARGRPSLVLADLAQDVNPENSLMPSQILAVIREFSKENRDLPLWLNDLRAAVKDDLHLVVVDHTGFEIPWELLTLPESQSGAETYLGAVVSTARWQDITDDKTFNDLPLKVAHEEHAGRIAAFVDEHELEGGGQEAAVLAELHAALDPGLKQLEDRLSRPEAGFGLVYLACHGQWAPTLLDFALGAASVTGDRLVLGLLQAKRLPFFELSKAVVFINSCHSGRMFKEEQYLHTSRLRGFPELFLGKGASGVIGTTGWVNDRIATETASWLLRTLCTSDESVSQILRRRRAEVLKSLPAEPSEDERVALLNAFMYVYYGNPLSRLRIVEDPS